MHRLVQNLILELHAQGKTRAAIAKEAEVSTWTVSKVIQQAGLVDPARSAGSRITPEKLAKAKAMLDDGNSLTEVCKTLRMGMRTLQRHFPEHAKGWGQGWQRQALEKAAMMRRLNAL